MEKNIYYRLDYGRYDSVGKWNNFCSADCRCFSDCLGKGGFCSSTKRRDLQLRPKDFNEVKKLPISNPGDDLSQEPLFWHFPEGKGTLQPWRRNLWKLNK